MEHSKVTDVITKLALSKRKYFCQNCNIALSVQTCSYCGSDDLLSLLDGVGTDIGISWIEDNILNDVEEAPLDFLFDKHLTTLYGTRIKICSYWYTLVEAMKAVDPYSYEIKKYEFIRAKVSDGTIYDHNGRYLLVSEILSVLDSH